MRAAGVALLLGAGWPAMGASSDKPAAPPASPNSAVEAMAESIARQRAAIQKQVGASPSASSSFFSVPWLSPPPGSGAEADCDPLAEAVVQPLIGQAAQSNGLKVELIRAVIRQESGFRPCAVSSKGAMGLMQLMPATVQQYSVREPFDAKENIAAGAKLLKELLARYKGDLRTALAAYNAGPSNLPPAGGVPDNDETRKYVEAILASLSEKAASPPAAPSAPAARDR
ncbi:MAG: lytic transglycosylase domain-containing protein [Acidobacteria bacterium]|nr:lytic transglycosylase domain-containing protein [Acidobacteriota bacterium]